MKVAHFVPFKTQHQTKILAELYVEHILRLHRAPKSIVSDRGSQFVAKFWWSFHKLMGTTLSYSIAFHPQTDGQTERDNQVLEDMLSAHLQHRLGEQLTICRVLLQQQLSSESSDGTF
jgi:transposase InsO family protein